MQAYAARDMGQCYYSAQAYHYILFHNYSIYIYIYVYIYIYINIYMYIK